MAAHLQHQILQALQAALVAASLVRAGNVHVDRPDAFAAEQGGLPAIDIRAGDEDVQALAMHIRAPQQRTLEIEIAFAADGPDAMADARDLARLAETALYATVTANTLGGLCNSLTLTGASQSFDTGASELTASVVQRWKAVYHTRSGAPDTPA